MIAAVAVMAGIAVGSSIGARIGWTLVFVAVFTGGYLWWRSRHPRGAEPTGGIARFLPQLKNSELSDWAVANGGRLDAGSAPYDLAPRNVRRAMQITDVQADEPGEDDSQVINWLTATPGGEFVEAFCVNGERPGFNQFVLIQAPRLPRLDLDIRADDVPGKRHGQQFEGLTFNQKWSVRSEDERYASLIITPRVMRLLEEAPDHLQNLTLFDGLVVSRTNVALDAASLDEHVRILHDFLNHIEPFVVRRYRQDQKGG